MTELIQESTLAEYEAFVQSHPKGHFAQSSLWAKQKPAWKWRAIVSRGADGRIRGSIAFLIRTMPYIHKTMLYACRGPVCDLDDRETFGELVAAALAARGEDIAFDVVSNPEFLKEGDAVSDFMKPDRVIVGTSSEKTASAMRDLYAPFARSREKLIVMSVRSAEMTKYAANCMLATKISFINEIATLCEKVGADVRDVRTGIGSDHRIGYQFIYPGIGYGGSCFPKDVKALIHTAHEAGMRPELLEAVEGVNARQKRSMAFRVADYFEPQGGVFGKVLALWGLAFKANTDDMRESPALSIIEELTSRGMRVRAYDPIAAPNARKLLADNPLVFIEDDPYAICEGSDALLVATEWNQFRNPDFDRIKESLVAPVLFDGRNLYSPSVLGKRGFAYFCVGKK